MRRWTEHVSRRRVVSAAIALPLALTPALAVGAPLRAAPRRRAARDAGAVRAARGEWAGHGRLLPGDRAVLARAWLGRRQDARPGRRADRAGRDALVGQGRRRRRV